MITEKGKNFIFESQMKSRLINRQYTFDFHAKSHLKSSASDLGQKCKDGKQNI